MGVRANAGGPGAQAASSKSQGVTIEFQRQKAKEMVAFFQEKNFEKQVAESKVFGFTLKNEIGNGR